MKLMTAASVRNLPNYLAEDRQRSLLQREEERYTKDQQEKKMVAQFGMELMSVLESGGDVKAGLDGLKQKYAGKMTPEMMQLTSNMVQNFKQNKRFESQDQIAAEDRQNLLDKTRQQDEAKDIVNRSLLGAGQMPYSGEGVGLSSYGVPAKDASRMGQTEQGLLNTLVDNPDAGFLMRDIQGKQAAARTDAEKTAADIAYKKAQTEQIGKPRQEATPMSYREWQLAGSPGKYEDWVKRGKGSTQTADDVKADIQAQFGITIEPGYPIETTPEQARQIQQYGQSRGLNVVVEPTKTGGGLFSDGEDAAIVRFGSFDPGRTGGQPGASEPNQAQGSTDFDDLLSAVTKNNPQPRGEASASTTPPIRPGGQTAGENERVQYGQRNDGTQKGSGYLGEIARPDGNVMTEFSVGVNIDGQEVDIPLVVPTLTPQEIETIKELKPVDDIPPSILQKAVEHARKRMAEGKSPFAEEGEQEEKPVDGRAPIVKFGEMLMEAGDTGATQRRKERDTRSFLRKPPIQ